MATVPCCPKVLSVEKRNCNTPACAPQVYPYQPMIPQYQQPLYYPQMIPQIIPVYQQQIVPVYQQQLLQPQLQPVINNQGTTMPITSVTEPSAQEKQVVINITNSQDTNSRNQYSNDENNPVTVTATEAQQQAQQQAQQSRSVLVKESRPVVLRRRPTATRVIERVRPTIERIHEKPVIVERVVENRVCVDKQNCKPYKYVEWS